MTALLPLHKRPFHKQTATCCGFIDNMCACVRVCFCVLICILPLYLGASASLSLPRLTDINSTRC